MKRSFDFDTQLMTEGSLGQVVEVLVFKRCAQGVLDILCVHNTIPFVLGGGFSGVLGVKNASKYDEPEFITGAAAQEVVVGDETIYRFVFSLQNETIDEALLVDGNIDNDLVTVDFMAEIKFKENTDAGEVRSQTVIFRIVNNVVRGGETVPDYEPPVYMLDDSGGDPEVMLGDDSQPLIDG